jgi:solute carrier family 29 (equilibrative nucleoside transporter), member 1/2/3
MQTIGLALAVKYQNRLPLTYRVLGPLLITSAIFILTTIFVTVKINPTFLFGITLLCCVVVGLSNALLSGGIFGLSGSFPPQYTGAVMSGQGLAGLVVSVASLLTIWTGDPVDVCTDDDGSGDDDSCEDYIDTSALAFFIITCIVMGTCVFTFLALLSLPFTRLVSFGLYLYSKLDQYPLQVLPRSFPGRPSERALFF